MDYIGWLYQFGIKLVASTEVLLQVINFEVLGHPLWEILLVSGFMVYMVATIIKWSNPLD